MKTIIHLLNPLICLALMGAMVSCDKIQDNIENLLDESIDKVAIPIPSTDDEVYPGQPSPYKIFFGAAVSGNGDPVTRHEEPSGHTLSLRRTFFGWRHRTDYMIRTAEDDLNNGRLPWVSIKPPPCPDGQSRCDTWDWAGMAEGAYDNEIDEMLQALAALPGPVWLTVHHEPEGGGGQSKPNDLAGGIQAHVDMNRRVRQRIDALGSQDNISLGLILMSWTWDSRSGRNADDWWESGIYDFLGVDIYSNSEQSLLKTGKPTPVFPRIRTWAADKGVDVAVGEWGMRGTDQAAGIRLHEWYNYAVNSATDGQGARVVGLSAFDSGLNSPNGSWELKGEQLRVFHDLLGNPHTASIYDEPTSGILNIANVVAGNSLKDIEASQSIDADTTTRWSSWNNLQHAWIRFDLGEIKTVDKLRLKLYKADIRGPFPLTISGGDDLDNPETSSGTGMTELWSGESTTSNGFQEFPLPQSSVRYLEIRMPTQHPGEYNKNMLSIWETEIWGSE